MAKTTLRKEQAGIPGGGSTGEALVKVSNADYDVAYGEVSSGGIDGLYASGVATFTPAGATQTQNIAHGLGTIPNRIRITFLGENSGSTTQQQNSHGTFDESGQRSVFFVWNTAGSGYWQVQSDTASIVGSYNASSQSVAVASADATNIILDWTNTNGGQGGRILWETWAVGGDTTDIFDDFLSITDTNSLSGDLMVLGKEVWSEAASDASTSAVMQTSEANHPGILALGESGTTYNGVLLGDVDTLFSFESPFTIEKMVRITTLGSTNAEYFFGLAVGRDATANQSRIGIYGDANGPSLWHGQTADGAATTSSGATAAIVADTWYKIKIVFDGTTVEWFVDGVSLGTTTATLPTGLANLVMLGRRNGAGDNASWEVDYSLFNYEVTR